MLRLIDGWVARGARPEPEALAAVTGLQPAWAITGGSEGIGLALAIEVARRGLPVLLIARDPARLASAAASVKCATSNAKVAICELDVSSREAADAIDSAAKAAGFYVDTLVNCAGLGLGGAFATHGAADIERLIDLNVAVVTRLTRHALPGMLARGRGGILNVASLGGYAPGPYQAAYYASKSYVLALTEAIAHEYRGRGVRIAVAAPGPVNTRFHARMGADHALYRYLLPALSAQAAARSILRGYRFGLGVIRPGLLTTPAAIAMKVVPHVLLTPLVGWLLKPRGTGG